MPMVPPGSCIRHDRCPFLPKDEVFKKLAAFNPLAAGCPEP